MIYFSQDVSTYFMHINSLSTSKWCLCVHYPPILPDTCILNLSTRRLPPHISVNVNKHQGFITLWCMCTCTCILMVCYCNQLKLANLRPSPSVRLKLMPGLLPCSTLLLKLIQVVLVDTLEHLSFWPIYPLSWVWPP